MTAAVPDATPSLRGPVLFWATLATVALAYLAALALNPDLVAPSRRADAAPSGTSAPPAATALAQAHAEIQVLQQTIATLKADIAAMKSAAAAGEERERDLMARLASAERAATPPAAPIVTGSLPSPGEPAAAAVAAPASEPAVAAPAEAVSAPAAAPPAKAVAARKAAAPSAEAVAPAAAKAAATARKPAPSPAAPAAAASGSEPVGSFTASVVPAPTAETAPVSPTVISRATAYGVQLASGSSVDSLRVSWGLINERHKGLLKGLEPRYAASADNGAPMTLVAGPLTTAEEAARICASLRAKRITCAVVSFDGRAL